MFFIDEFFSDLCTEDNVIPILASIEEEETETIDFDTMTEQEIEEFLKCD